jgi:membrane protease YdiL (CAAX protease family)
MRRVLDIRIVRWELKLAYVVGVLVVGWFPIGAVMYSFGATPVAASIVSTIVEMAAFLLAARIFRGTGEAVEPARAWWRMTARPALSRRLGILFLVLAVLVAAGFVLQAVGFPEPVPTGSNPETVVIGVIGLLQFAAIATLYLNSAVRLERLGVPPKEPKFRPTVKL